MVEASEVATSFLEDLCLPPRPFKVSDSPPATSILIEAFTSLSCNAPQLMQVHSLTQDKLGKLCDRETAELRSDRETALRDRNLQ